ncbi:MAG TPA: CHC2 zinc finger domain-containing protein [Methanobacterium sp.]|nr:CHC2 zinc finger domain-containing protein [Methanobacterium sp.]
MIGLKSFYQSFYGPIFYRHFRRPTYFEKIKFRIQFTVETPKSLYLHVHRNSGNHPCLIHTYDHGSRGNLKRNSSDKMVFDRVFLDFDVSNPEVKKIKRELTDLRRHGLKHEKSRQDELKDQLQDLIINDKIAKQAIDEAKEFAIKFKETFGNYPALFFSGCKGCHAYTFFKATRFQNLNLAVSWFAGNVKKAYNQHTLDLSVTQDAQARLSRIPYSKHQLTSLTIVPFSIEDDYNEIVMRSMNQDVEDFNKEDYQTDFHRHLQKIDQVETYNAKVKSINRIPNKVRLGGSKNFKGIYDHRVFFKSILGDPLREYPNKEYVMYNCPFNDHEDRKPSFRVHKKGYYCYGCQKRGNYWQFLRDFNNWDDKKVRKYLRNEFNNV